jgi:GNAT superfamily N-acetyltransferase
MSLVVRPARPEDTGAVFDLIRALADYEKRLDSVAATEADIRRALFADDARVHCDIAEWDGASAGFALWFLTYSTFAGRHGIYLEDLFVLPAQRGRGIGKALFAALARHAEARGCDRLSWSVLDWNADAIGFYESLGAEHVTEWLHMALKGEGLRRLAKAG